MRLFVACRPPEPALDHLTRFLSGLSFYRAGIRVVARPLWHVTLAFLGEVPDGQAAAAATATAAAAAAAPAVPQARLAGGGRFGRGRFTLLWAGVQGELKPVRDMLVRRLRRAKLPVEATRFRPHLTLARPGDRIPAEQVTADLAALAGYQGPWWPVRELVLVRSHLGPHPVHEPIASAVVAGTSDDRGDGGPALRGPDRA